MKGVKFGSNRNQRRRLRLAGLLGRIFARHPGPGRAGSIVPLDPHEEQTLNLLRQRRQPGTQGKPS